MKIDPIATDLLIRITLLREADDEDCHTEAWRLWGMYEQIFGMPPSWEVWDEAHRLMKREPAFKPMLCYGQLAPPSKGVP